MRLSDFDFDLPEDRIALRPASPRDSARLLVSNPGYAMRTVPQSNPVAPQPLLPYAGAKDWWTLEGQLNTGAGPVWMERVNLQLTIRTSAEKIQVYPLDGAGQRQASLKSIERIPGGFRIRLSEPDQPFSPWFEIIR